MIRRLSRSIVNWQISKKIIISEQSALYFYAYEILMNQTINILIAILIAFVLRATMPVFVFFVSYLPLRAYCGGHHAKTNGGCAIVSAILIVIVCCLEKIIPGELAFFLSPICFVISGASIFVYAPVSSINKPLDELETRHYRKKSIIIWLMQVIVGVGLWCFNLRASVVISISHAILSLMLLYGVFLNKKAFR